MSRILLLNKPFNVLCQFTDAEGRPTLADYIQEKGFYPAGRLDRDSEGLVVLTDDGRLQHCIAHPDLKLEKTYWVQVEGQPDEEALQKLRQGVKLKDGMTRAARVERLDEPALWPRHPPIRYRATIPDTWLQLTISEGRNRQVRRMTAAVGYPTLRLVRWRTGDWSLAGLQPGESREIDPADVSAFQKRCLRLNRHRPGDKARPAAKGRRASNHNRNRGRQQ